MKVNGILDNGNSFRTFVTKNLITIILSVAAALAVYYSTVSSLQLSLSGKVDAKQYHELERRITSVENATDRNFISREDFFDFKEDIQYRLFKIEFKLENLLQSQTTDSLPGG
ncbi:MAG: hypothetical protein GF315_05405 [candidate division Zixibacteria bacterium]|nr:hypothetical protein [candidate division Zixibacteria bacterium]